MLRFFFDPHLWLQRDCALTQDYSLAANCFNSKGGVRRCYIIEFANVYNVITDNHAVTSFTLATGKKFWTYEVTRGTTEGSADLQVNQETNSQHSVESLKLVLNTMTAAISKELTSLAGNRLRVVVVDRNNNGWLYGKEYGMTAKSIKALTGKAGSDRNGYELELEGDEDELPYYVPASVFGAMITPGP